MVLDLSLGISDQSAMSLITMLYWNENVSHLTVKKKVSKIEIRSFPSNNCEVKYKYLDNYGEFMVLCCVFLS